MTSLKESGRFLRLPEVVRTIGLSRAWVYDAISKGNFPRPIPLGGTRAVAWLESDVSAWVREQIDKARGASAGEVGA